jgi:3-hydroxyacyl-CoA dehydrogenase / 3-hydroxy-2-methylbutyryl-CoA dehydrogenase
VACLLQALGDLVLGADLGGRRNANRLPRLEVRAKIPAPAVLECGGYAAAPMRIAEASGLVAGGASGLGAATTRALHAAGASVVVCDLNVEKGEALVAELGERAAFVEANVIEQEPVQAAVEAAAGAEGGLRISVCCAGIGWAERTAGKRGPHDLEVFHNVIKVNLIGTFNVLRLASAAMVDNEPDEGGERGVCINTASIAAFDGQIGQVAYAASKGGIVGLTLPAARDLAGRGVRVVTIAPGTFDTPLLAALPPDARQELGAQIPFPNRLGEPAEFGALACHVIENSMLNGETIRLDGALRMPPR